MTTFRFGVRSFQKQEQVSRGQLAGQDNSKQFDGDLLRLAESIASRNCAVIETGFEPVHTLLGSAVRERFRAYMACGHFLKTVITDGSRCT